MNDVNNADLILTESARCAKNRDTMQRGAKLADYNRQLQAHIDMLEAAIKESKDPAERERGRAAIRRFKKELGAEFKK